MRTLLRMRKTVLMVAAILAVSLALVSWLGRNIADPAWLALGLAIAAACVAVYGTLKAGLLEFRPEVLGGDVIVPRPSRAGGDVKLLLPLQFTNSGSVDGIVEWVALRLTVDGEIQRSVLLSPVAEVDMQRFIQAKRRLDNENCIEPFTAFALEGKRSLAKFVLFDVAEKQRGDPLRLRSGRWSFEVFVKSTANRSPKLERTFEHVVEKKHVDEFAADAPVYLINYQITLPAARREMAGAEWMPRTAKYSN